MIEVVISENGRVIDRLQFDADTLVNNRGDIASMHRGIMRQLSPSDDIWRRVSHAASYLAGVRYFQDLFRRLEGFVYARGLRNVPASLRIVKEPHTREQLEIARPQIEIDDDDLYRLQRDADECEADYLARCEMLGCNQDGFIRLPRRA